MYVRLLHVTGPKLIFAETDDETLKITDNGSKVECGEFGRKWCTVLTDGRLKTGRHYWEMEISMNNYRPSDPELVSDTLSQQARVGVLQESSALQKGNRSKGRWCVQISQSFFNFSYLSGPGCVVKPAYKQELPHSGPHHIGLFLNCDDKSLTGLDRDNNAVIFTVSNLDFSESLVPFVQFVDINSASARLVTGDSAILPRSLCDVIIKV